MDQEPVFSSSMDQWPLIAFTIIVIAGTWWLLLSLFKKSNTEAPPLPPGPRGLPIVGNLLSLDPELHTYFTDLARTYGPIYSLKLGNRRGIVISSPALAREVLRNQDTVFANRDVPAAGKEATYGGKDIVWNPYGPEWRMLRKVCVVEMLGKHMLDSVYSLRKKEVRRMIKYVYDAAAAVNVGEQMFLSMLNVITSMMWGGTMEGEQRAVLGAEFRQAVAEMTALLGMPNVSDFYPALARFDLQGVQKKMKVLVKRFDDIFAKIIGDRLGKETTEESKDFLQVLLKLRDTNVDFTMTHLKALLMDMVVGGTDTTSNTVEFALAEMMANPQILRKAQQELETTVGKHNMVEESHIHHLPYLYAVMKETLRLHPALPLLVPHSPSSTATVSGYTIPKGSRVFVNVWAIHRDPDIWESPSEFRPERFLEGKWDYSGNDFNYFPFGSGRRICAGTAMAERVFMFSLASLVHSFDWSWGGDGDSGKVDLEEKFGIVLKKRAPLVAVATPRLADANLYAGDLI
ncbi:flavonoid 3'-monooxygenase CYP75B137-like [Henckelia pumila]|uniref:flavonoid 3'-monooxygenase CYP75B137-like n=1 Tax=Henckelia pumila TaxID=405737 RepID=UPI003C6E09ED